MLQEGKIGTLIHPHKQNNQLDNEDFCISGNFAIGEGFSAAANSTVGAEYW
jgi:hypothetical protein